MPFIPDEQLKQPQRVQPTPGFVPDALQGPGFIQSTIQDIASPFARIGVTAARLGQTAGGLAGAVLGKVVGNENFARQSLNYGNEALTKPADLGYLGKVEPLKPIFKDTNILPDVGALREATGVGIQAATSLYTPEAGLNVAKQGLKGLIRQGVKAGVKEGAQLGGTYALGKGLEQHDPIGDLIARTAEGIVGGVGIGGTLGGVTPVGANVVNKVIQRVRPTVERLKSDVIPQFITAIRPSVRGKVSVTDLERYNNQAVDAVFSIIENKPNLQFKNEAGEVVTGQLPKTVFETADAIRQTKRGIYQAYNYLTKQATGNEAKIDVTPTLSRIIHYTRDVSNSPQIRAFYERILPAIKELQGATPEMIEKRIEEYNARLGGLSTGAISKPEAQAFGNVAALLRSELDNLIERGSGIPGYQVLKNRYGALKAVEKDVVNRYLVDARKNPAGFFDITDIFNTGNIAEGLLNANPAQVSRGVFGYLAKKTIKRLNDPNRIISTMFSDAERVVNKIEEQGGRVREAPTPRGQLLLPPGNPNGPRFQDNVPISLGARSQSTIDTQEQQRIQGQRFGNVKNSLSTRNEYQSPLERSFSPKKPGKVIIKKNVPLNFDQLKFVGDDLYEAQQDVLNGKKSLSKKILVREEPDGSYTVLDGHHWIIQNLQKGIKDFKVEVEKRLR